MRSVTARSTPARQIRNVCRTAQAFVWARHMIGAEMVYVAGACVRRSFMGARRTHAHAQSHTARAACCAPRGRAAA
eukprot:5635613-Prymnesium_polylepis.1